MEESDKNLCVLRFVLIGRRPVSLPRLARGQLYAASSPRPGDMEPSPSPPRDSTSISNGSTSKSSFKSR